MYHFSSCGKREENKFARDLKCNCLLPKMNPRALFKITPNNIFDAYMYAFRIRK